jgi:hypothetical protein
LIPLSEFWEPEVMQGYGVHPDAEKIDQRGRGQWWASWVGILGSGAATSRRGAADGDNEAFLDGGPSPELPGA